LREGTPSSWACTRADKTAAAQCVSPENSLRKRKGLDDHRVLGGKLVFNDRMNDRVTFYARHTDLVPSMVVLGQYHALLLIEV